SYPGSTNYVDQDDLQILALKDIYDNPSQGIISNASYDDEGTMADFTNLDTTVNVSLIPTLYTPFILKLKSLEIQPQLFKQGAK
ncbi:hypothetical protein Tco_0443629, partial [Tanacetum coccineum]